jgi:hypothetical protein
MRKQSIPILKALSRGIVRRQLDSKPAVMQRIHEKAVELRPATRLLTGMAKTETCK